MSDTLANQFQLLINVEANIQNGSHEFLSRADLMRWRREWLVEYDKWQGEREVDQDALLKLLDQADREVYKATLRTPKKTVKKRFWQ